MKNSIKIIISAIAVTFILNGCFSSRDLEYDYDYDEFHKEVVIIEYVPVPSSPIYIPVDPTPQYPVVEEPRKKCRTSGVVSSRPSQNGRGISYHSRGSHRNSSSINHSGRKDRHAVEKRTRKRR